MSDRYCNHERAWDSTPSYVSVSKTPAHEASCEHPEESFVGSVTYLVYPKGGKQDKRTVDVYVFDEGGSMPGSQRVCIRYGSDGGDYISPGTVLDLLIKSRETIDKNYHAAADLIDSSFRIRAERREKGFWREKMDRLGMTLTS